MSTSECYTENDVVGDLTPYDGLYVARTKDLRLPRPWADYPTEPADALTWLDEAILKAPTAKIEFLRSSWVGRVEATTYRCSSSGREQKEMVETAICALYIVPSDGNLTSVRILPLAELQKWDNDEYEYLGEWTRQDVPAVRATIAGWASFLYQEWEGHIARRSTINMTHGKRITV